MLKFVALAAAVTVAGPNYSGTVQEREIAPVAERGEGSARERQRQALTVLIQQQWLEGEAAERGIVITPRQVDEAYEEEIGDFASPAERRRALRALGHTEATLKARLRAQLLEAALRDQVTEPAAKSVTPDQVNAYVDANPQVTPATRTVRYVHARSRRDALKVLDRLRRGATWASVGGDRRTVPVNGHPAGRAMFQAPVGQLRRYGRWVFRVSLHRPERPAPRAEQEARAWERLSSQAQERALQVFVAEFSAKWRQRTSCATQYRWHEDCGQPPSGQEEP